MPKERSYPHDVDGVADDFGGALLALGSFEHGLNLAGDSIGWEGLLEAKLFAKASGSVLLIEAHAEGIFLYEFRADGFIGDTWHQSIEDAKKQASFQFDAKETDWRVMPEGIADPAACARQNSN